MAKAAWTWMVYLATYNNAAQAGNDSVARMCRAQLNDRVRVLVQQSVPGRTVRGIVGADPMLVADLGSIDSGAPQSVIDFVRWAAETAPAERYALVLWSHGSGWEPSEMERLMQQPPAGEAERSMQPPPAEPVTARELTERGAADEGRQAFFSTTMRELLVKPTRIARAIAFDDGSGHSLDTVELGWIAAAAARILGQPLDLLGMNACQMGNVEVAYQVRNGVRVYVGSEEDMPVESWPYDDILTRLAAGPDADAEPVGRMIVERYCAYFRDNANLLGLQGRPPGVTLAAVNPGRAGPLIEAVKALAVALQDDIDGQLQAVWDGHRRAHVFKFGLSDLAGFCRILAAHSSAAPASAEAARAALVALEDPAFMVKQEHVSAVYDDAGGLTTYLMKQDPYERSLSPHYDETDYAQATGWGDFLAAYHEAAS